MTLHCRERTHLEYQITNFWVVRSCIFESEYRCARDLIYSSSDLFLNVYSELEIYFLKIKWPGNNINLSVNRVIVF
jgi:hypothetical protein